MAKSKVCHLQMVHLQFINNCCSILQPQSDDILNDYFIPMGPLSQSMIDVHTKNSCSTRLNRSRRGILKHGYDCYRNEGNPRGNRTIEKLEMHVVTSQENGYHSNGKI